MGERCCCEAVVTVGAGVGPPLDMCAKLHQEVDRAVALIRTTKIQKLVIAFDEGLPEVVVYRISDKQVRIDLIYTDVEASHG